MRFIETCHGRFINVDEVQQVIFENYEHFNGNKQYHSFLILKDGSKFEFLDLPEKYEGACGNQMKFGAEQARLLLRIAIYYSIERDQISSDEFKDLKNEVWQMFSSEQWRIENARRVAAYPNKP